MGNKELLNVVENGGLFSVQYGCNSFIGTMSNFVEECKNFVDYANKPNNYFGFAVWVDGHEYEVERGFKSLLLKAIKSVSLDNAKTQLFGGECDKPLSE